MPARPIRVKLKNELGISTSLPEGEQCFHWCGHGKDILVLCPGPDPDLCRRLIPPDARTYVLMQPEFNRQMPPGWADRLPPAWIPVDPVCAAALAPEARILHYGPATRIFPSLYLPLLAQTRPLPVRPDSNEIWLPGESAALIIPELARAATILGLRPRLLPADLPPTKLIELLETGHPRLFLSINLRGLDPYGENQALLAKAGVPVALWCVDNPLHLLCGQKNRLWLRLPLYVTDSWFIEPLQSLGADPRHLPLATWLQFFPPGPPCPRGRELLFVGRASFPDRDRFFAASRVPESLAKQAAVLSGRTAHFGWWREQLPDIALWPGNDVRVLGLGAELASTRWRSDCLQALARRVGLNVVGDQTWAGLVPQATHLPPVDYYHGLAQCYAASPFTLNLTSLLLPHGLTQRHFDVWACGGFLLTDNTPGLDIFPADLTRAVSFETPEQALSLLFDLEARPGHKEELRRAWQELIIRDHTYTRRLAHILENCQPQPATEPVCSKQA